MKQILILGSGNIGGVLALMLAKKYKVTLAAIKHDVKLSSDIEMVVLDATSSSALQDLMNQKKIDAVISCLPHFITQQVAKTIIAAGIAYFDLTEDVVTTKKIASYAKNAKNIVVPQCGLAPGFISIITKNIMQHFDEIDSVKMRVGALPINVSNALQYALTWSTDGLINEYIQDSIVLRDYKKIVMPGLSGLETLKIDGLTYEAFHTSGGVGSLVDSFVGRVNNMDYKTIRYPGHCEKMQFLLKQLQLENHPDWLKQILENAIPRTSQDMVLVYVSVIGKQNGLLIDRHYVKKFYSSTINSYEVNAIQRCTSASAAAVLDLLINSEVKSGIIRQEEIDFNAFINNQYGALFEIK